MLSHQPSVGGGDAAGCPYGLGRQRARSGADRDDPSVRLARLFGRNRHSQDTLPTDGLSRRLDQDRAPVFDGVQVGEQTAAHRDRGPQLDHRPPRGLGFGPGPRTRSAQIRQLVGRRSDRHIRADHGDHVAVIRGGITGIRGSSLVGQHKAELDRTEAPTGHPVGRALETQASLRISLNGQRDAARPACPGAPRPDLDEGRSLHAMTGGEGHRDRRVEADGTRPGFGARDERVALFSRA